MSLYGMRELIDGVRTVRAGTIQIATDIPAEHYGFRPAAESRSVAETLVHIAWLWSFDRYLHADAHLDSLDGFDFPTLIAQSRAEEAKVRSKAEIVTLLRVEGERFAEWLEQLPPAILPERVQMPGGGSVSRFELLLGTKEHEMHHRAQLTVLERLVGVVPHFSRATAAAA
jgi:uncharacterized damage-inducible protein DinB